MLALRHPTWHAKSIRPVKARSLAVTTCSTLCKHDKVQPETLAGRGFVEEEAPLQNVLQREVLAAKLVRWKDMAMLTLGNDFPETELATEFGNRLFRYLPILPYRDCS